MRIVEGVLIALSLGMEVSMHIAKVPMKQAPLLIIG